MNEVQTQMVEFEGTAIRREWSEEQQRWGFVGVDAAAAAGYDHPAESLRDIVKRNRSDFEGETWMSKLLIQGQRRRTTMLSKQGMYKLAMLAGTALAVRFRDWVANTLTDLDEGRKALVPGPNATDTVERVEAREQTIESGKAAHRAIQDAGGAYYHHINWEKRMSRVLHGCEPKEFKEANHIPNGRPVADFEGVEALGIRAFSAGVLARLRKLGQLDRTTLSDRIRTVPESTVRAFEEQTGSPLLESGVQPDIGPAITAARKERRLLAAPVNGAQMTFQLEG